MIHARKVILIPDAAAMVYFAATHTNTLCVGTPKNH